MQQLVNQAGPWALRMDQVAPACCVYVLVYSDVSQKKKKLVYCGQARAQGRIITPAPLVLK
jgi:hypothetical protein